tara:strand:- start:3 stop:140 length:138 start_codon:yes stop_codon:yes gene_type:complete
METVDKTNLKMAIDEILTFRLSQAPEANLHNNNEFHIKLGVGHQT